MKSAQEWNNLILSSLANISSAVTVSDERIMELFRDQGLTEKILDAAITALLNDKKICFCRTFKASTNKWSNVMYATGCDPQSRLGTIKGVPYAEQGHTAISKKLKRKCKTCSNSLAEEKFLHGSRRCIACVENTKRDRYKKNSTKRCYTCKTILPLEKFNLDKSTKRCIACTALFPIKQTKNGRRGRPPTRKPEKSLMRDIN